MWFGDLFYQEKKEVQKSFHCVFIAGDAKGREKNFIEGEKEEKF